MGADGGPGAGAMCYMVWKCPQQLNSLCGGKKSTKNAQHEDYFGIDNCQTTHRRLIRFGTDERGSDYSFP